MKNNKLLIIVGASIFFMIIGVSAATILYTANNVTYSNSSLSGNNVQTALDNLYQKFESSKTTCPSGMTCTPKTNIKCKRATTLHTEECLSTQTNMYCKNFGYTTNGSQGTTTITYGNPVSKRGVLTTGDAFDCDVNGDGIFNSQTERFYYICDYYDTTNNRFYDHVAVLVYYSSVTAGVPSFDELKYATMADSQTVGTCTSSSGCNWYGPATAMKQLPTTTQWSNISLYNDTRQLLSYNSMTTSNSQALSLISYSGYAARLLTTQELLESCYSYDTYFNRKCLFLEERTDFSDSSRYFNGFWLETADPFSTNRAYYLSGVFSSASSFPVTDSASTRPVIEIPKSQISY